MSSCSFRNLVLPALCACLLAQAAGAPVAVNDSFSTNEDTELSLSGSAFLSEAFNLPLNDTRGFTFVPHIFTSSATNSSIGTGSETDIEGNPPGGLQVIQPFRAVASAYRTAGWQNTFIIGSAQTVRVSFDYRATTNGSLSANARLLVQRRIGTTGAVTTVETLTGSNQDSGWKTHTFTVALNPGTHTLQFGVRAENDTQNGASSTSWFDNVKVEPLNVGGVLANDTGGATVAILDTQPAHGVLVFDANGTFSYTPALNYHGPDSFTYHASDGVENSNIATVSITVNPVNDAPVAVNDSFSTDEDTPLTVPPGSSVLLNDTDVENSPLTAVLATQAANGAVTLNANGSFTYTPNPDFFGTDSFTYHANDGTADGNTATVTISVNPVNDPPQAVNDTYVATKNQVLTVSSPAPATGTVHLIPFGAVWKYLDNGTDQGTAWRAPAFDDSTWASGPAQLGYGEGDEATVIEDDATPGSPTPGSTTRYITSYFRHKFTVSNKATLNTLTLNIRRDDAAIVYLNGTVISDATIQNGLANDAAYDTPGANDLNDGQVVITLTVANGINLLNDGENTIAVEVHQDTPNSSDVSFDLSLSAERSATDVTLIPLGATWSYLDNGTNQGTAWRNLAFDDSAWKSGAAELGYGDGDEVTVIEDDATPGSPTPGSTTRYITTYFRHKFTVTDRSTLRDLVLTLKRDDGAVAYLNGTVISNATMHNGLSSNPGFTDGASNAVDDGATLFTVSLTAGQNLLVEGENILAVEVHQQNSSSSDVSFNASLTAKRVEPAGVLANDIEPDGQSLSAVIVTPPANGSLALNANGTFTYTPNPNFSGMDSFTYAASDGSDSSNATVNITVISGPNSPPVAAGDSYNASEDTQLVVPAGSGVLQNDSDSDLDPLTAAVITQPAHGVLSLNADGSFTYDPAPNYFGPDSFTYTASDGIANSIPATVNITVSGMPDPPVATGDSYATDRGAPLTVSAPGVLANDSDPDGDAITAVIVAPPSNGSFNLNANGSFSYTPPADFSGVVSFTYRATDGVLSSAPVSVTIAVSSRPAAAPDIYISNEDSVFYDLAPGVLANDSDPDGDPLAAELVAPPSHGTLNLIASGAFVYIPQPHFSGPDTFTYRVSDGTRSSADATVTINVTPVNDPPTASDDVYDVPLNETTEITASLGVLANDTDIDSPSLSAEILSAPAHGTVEWSANGAFLYTPPPGFTGSTSFQYRARDGALWSAAATVTINVQRQSAIVINEIMFNAPSGQPMHEWIELLNTSSEPVSLRGWRISQGVDFTFPDVTLPPGGTIIAAANVAAFQALFPAATNVVGPWTGGLSNRGENIQIENALGKNITEVRYSDQGDWANRRVFASGGRNGWQWISGADGTGQSLQLLNPALPQRHGRNWVSAAPTPDAPNAVASSNLAPLISDVKHRPILPSPTDQVYVTARFADEALTPPTSKVTYRTWARPGPADDTSTPTAWVDSTMFDDGLHGDGAANDGTFGATIPALPLNTIVEFYVHSTDGTNASTWPAPTDDLGTQGANCLYIVDTETYTGTRPFYRLVMTGQDEIDFRFANWPSASDAALNVTFIAQQGADFDVRYRGDIRIRGASSRDRNPRNWRVGIPHDDEWQGRVDMNLNTQYIYNQLMGSRLMELAGLPREEATIVQVRLNGINHATDNQNNRRFSHYIDLAPLDSVFASDQFPEDDDGNLYKKVRPDNKWAPRNAAGGGPNVAAYLADGWIKQTNGSINDWTDLHTLLRTFTDTVAGPNYYTTINQVADVDQFVRWFAVCTIMNHRETNISNGADDDYSIYRGVTDPRFKLIGHDFDTLFNIGDTTTSATAGIYQVIDNFGGTTIPVFNRFFQDPTIARKYKAQLRELLTTVFSKTNFDAAVDNLLPTDWIPSPHGNAGGGVPDPIQTAMKTFMDTRRAHILSLIPSAFTATSSLAIQNGYPTTTSANASGLGGVMDAALTARITVNGTPVTLDNYNGTWSAGTAVTLRPGLNTLTCIAYDENDAQLASATVRVMYDDGSISAKGGTLTTSEVWTSAGGPYSVGSNLTIPSGITLTIQPGATVFLSPNVAFTVSAGGRLIAEGTPMNPVTFMLTPSDTGAWPGIVVSGAGSEARISHATILGNSATAITAQTGARLVLDTITFGNTAQPFLLLDGASFSVTNTAFPAPSPAFAAVTGNGIATGGEALFRNCTFAPVTGDHPALSFSNCARPGPILRVLDCTFAGSAASLIRLTDADAWIENNALLHAHLNSAEPLSSAIRAGGTSRITALRNFIYDCDHAITVHDGAAFAALSNTIARITATGGTDTAAAAFSFSTGAGATGAGGHASDNIITDTAALTRHYHSGTTPLTLENNILPTPWSGPGSANSTADPMLNLTLITDPPTATAAQIRAAFIPQPCSPALRTGTFGRDKGAVIPAGIALAGVPPAPIATSALTLAAGPAGDFAGTFPYGYTHYTWALDSAPMSAETPIATPLTLSAIPAGTHTLSLLGKNDAGIWQTTPTHYTITVNPAAITVLISEILASNVNAYPVGTTRPDAIELFNYGPLPVDLTGYTLSDDPGDPARFTLPPGTTIPAGGRLILLGDNPNANPGIHIGFGLRAEGDSLALYPPGSVPGSIPVDSVTFGLQIPDLAIARTGDTGAWALSTPTLGQPNTALCVTGDPAALRINEWLSSNDIAVSNDFLELYNPSSLPIALGGLHLTDDPTNYPTLHAIPPLSYIAPGGFIRFIADGDTHQGADHLGFAISRIHETLALTDATGRILDQVPVVPQIEDQSQGRITDGGPDFTYFPLPTPGFSNTAYTPAQITAQAAVIASLRITELMFQPPLSTHPEFIEFKNISTTDTLDLSGVTFRNGLTHTFPNGTTLPPGAYLVITENLSRFNARYPGVPATQWASGRLDNAGERLRIETPGAIGILDFRYSENWYPTTAGGGASLQIINPLADRHTWDEKSAWQPSTTPTPGGPPVFAVSAGPDLTIQPGLPAFLRGSVVLGDSSGSLDYFWSKTSGPGTVHFTSQFGLNTDATFTTPGIYTLQLSAEDLGLGGVVTDTVTLNVTESYTSWAARTIADPALRGETLDLDDDLLTNLAEFAMGLNPTLRDQWPLDLQKDGQKLSITYQRDLSIGGITLRLMESTNLPAWAPADADEQILVTNGSIQIIKATVPASTPMKALKIEVTKP